MTLRSIRATRYEILDVRRSRPYHRAMIHVATIVIARRRRIIAAGLDVRV